MLRVLAAATLAAAALLPAASASATECTPRGCTGACYIDREAESPFRIVRCYS